MPKILIESRANALRLAENATPRKGCLGRIEGICADYANPTRNGRFYSRKLWENVFNATLVKEALETKTLIGELDHPEERFEPLASEACVVMTDYKFDDNEQVVHGGFDILDTPAGRILKSFLDYGSVVGVSSRGQGDIIQGPRYEEVEPDTYEFACFDVVLTPAVMKARQTVTEGVQRKKLSTLSASIMKEVNESKSVAELDAILRVIESAGMSNMANVKLAIRNKRKSLIECETITQNDEELQQAKKEIEDLKEQHQAEITKTIRENNELKSTLSNLSSQVLAYRHREEKLCEAIELLKAEKLSEGNISAGEILELKSDNVRLQRQVESLERSVSNTMERYTAVVNNEESIKSQVTNFAAENKELKESLSQKSDEVKQLTESFNQLKESSEKSSKASKATLTESAKREAASNKLLTSFRHCYIESICSKYGIDSAVLMSNITDKTSAEAIESQAKSLVEKLDRYSSLPFATSAPRGTKVLNENISAPKSAVDAELEASRKFIESAAGVNNL